MTKDHIPLMKLSLGASELDRIAQVLKSGQLVQAGTVQQFEQRLQERLHVEHAVAVSSGTSALHVALTALEVGRGDDVVVPDFCFPSVAASVLAVGANCVLCDIDPSTFNSGLAQIERALTPRTKVVILVHQFGVPAGAKELVSALPCIVLEDAACALGAVDHGRPCGTWGEAGCFSFHPRKIITTGEGGLICTQSEALAHQFRTLRNHGMRPSAIGVEFEHVGMSARMTELHAAVGLGQFDQLDALLAGRHQVAQWYREALCGVDGLIVSDATWHPDRVYQSLVIRVETAHLRDRLMTTLRERGIESTLGTYAIHQQSAYSDRCQQAKDGLAESTRAQAETLTLPLWAGMSQGQVDRVVQGLREGLC
jgi:perosamine synthetase